MGVHRFAFRNKTLAKLKFLFFVPKEALQKDRGGFELLQTVPALLNGTHFGFALSQSVLRLLSTNLKKVLVYEIGPRQGRLSLCNGTQKGCGRWY
jgi:hypothetical protein